MTSNGAEGDREAVEGGRLKGGIKNLRRSRHHHPLNSLNLHTEGVSKGEAATTTLGPGGCLTLEPRVPKAYPSQEPSSPAKAMQKEGILLNTEKTVSAGRKKKKLHIEFLRALCIWLVMFTHTSTAGFSLYIEGPLHFSILSIWLCLSG